MFASDLEKVMVEYKPDLWIHGHMHLPVDVVVDKTRVLCNPHGYPHEPNNGFNPDLIVEI